MSIQKSCKKKNLDLSNQKTENYKEVYNKKNFQSKFYSKKYNQINEINEINTSVMYLFTG